MGLHISHVRREPQTWAFRVRLCLSPSLAIRNLTDPPPAPQSPPLPFAASPSPVHPSHGTAASYRPESQQTLAGKPSGVAEVARRATRPGHLHGRFGLQLLVFGVAIAVSAELQLSLVEA